MKTKILIFGILFSLIYSCKKDESNDIMIKKELFDGYVQKGPFINGSSITISELDDKLNQTGRSYSTTIADNSGKFEQKNIELSSNYVSLKADGFYFNENIGDKSSAQLTLNAIADITDESSVNVNILTHLEKSRIEYLVNQKGYTFKDAKSQAIKDILNLFSIKKDDIVNSETLSLIKDGDDNAILFAISVIVQGYRTTADMSELLANIITDIKEDGQLNDSTLGSKLIDDAKLLDLDNVRQNMENRYKDLGISITLPSFEKYVKLFIDSAKYKRVKVIDYPATSNYGTNILNDLVSIVTVPQGENYSMAANLPIGTSLKVVLKGGLWFYRFMPDGPINWTISLYDNEEQSFTATESGKNCDLNIEFSNPDTLNIEFYENNSITPTKIKKLIVQ
jgi:hypothetical protein